MLTAFQETKLRLFFNVLDYDKNGFVELKDFQSIGENISLMLELSPSDPIVSEINSGTDLAWNDLYSYVDQNKDDRASIYEWLLYADEKIVNCEKDVYDKYVKKVVEHIFVLFDRNKDDFISLHEYLNLFMTFRLEARHSAKAFIRLDLNKDNLISREELMIGVEEFFRSDDINANGNWLFGSWEHMWK